MTTPSGELSQKAILTLFERLAEARPDPRTELSFLNPYTLLVAVALSAQTTDKAVNQATGPLFAVADSPERMLALGEERLKDAIKTIGLFNTKARNILAMSRLLIERHGGKVPRDRSALEALPGVGRKTASVVLAEAFGEKTLAVDTHVFRVANRTGLARGKTPLAVEERLLERVPERFLPAAHHWLILHGRYVCTARAPKCSACPIADLCLYEGKAEEAGPAKGKVALKTTRRKPSAPRRKAR